MKSTSESQKLGSYAHLVASMGVVQRERVGGKFGVSCNSLSELRDSVEDFEYFTRGDLKVSSLAAAQAISDLSERVEQVTLWLKYHPECKNESYEWNGEFETNDLSEYLPIESFDYSSILRYLFMSDCGLHAYSVSCECGIENTVPYYHSGGDSHKRVCPSCSARESRSRAKRAMYLIAGFAWQHLGFLTLTTPSDYLDPFQFDSAEYIHAKQEEFFRVVSKYMRKVFPEQPYVASFHHWHSGAPLSTPHFHMHITFGWIRCSRSESGEKTIGYLEPFVPLDLNAFYDEPANKLRYILEWDNRKRKYVASPMTIETMRDVWAKCLGIPAEQSNLHYQYLARGSTVDQKIHARSKLLHWLRYCFRSYIEDANRWFLDLESAGESFEDECWQWLEWHLRINNYEQVEVHSEDSDIGTYTTVHLECGDWQRRTRYYGAWSNSQVNEWIQYGTKKEPEKVLLQYKQDGVEDSRLYCRECQQELVVEEWSMCPVVPFSKATAALRRVITRPIPEPSLRWGFVEVVT